MGEQWRPIPGHPRYEVSDDGQVRAWQEPGWRGCIHHDGRWVLLKQTTGGRVHNYKRVRLHIDLGVRDRNRLGRWKQRRTKRDG